MQVGKVSSTKLNLKALSHILFKIASVLSPCALRRHFKKVHAYQQQVLPCQDREPKRKFLNDLLGLLQITQKPNNVTLEIIRGSTL